MLRLSWGNGILELGTFLGVIAGAGVAGMMADRFQGHQAWSGLVFLGLAVLGLATSLGVTRVPAAAPAKKFVANPLADLWAQGRLIRADQSSLAGGPREYLFLVSGHTADS